MRVVINFQVQYSSPLNFEFPCTRARRVHLKFSRSRIDERILSTRGIELMKLNGPLRRLKIKKDHPHAVTCIAI